MPDMSGLEVCRFLRESNDPASLPILVLTADGGQGALLRGLSAGANDFVAKAFHPGEFKARVATLIRGKVLHERIKRAEAESRNALATAERAGVAKEAFLATASHELRSPLNAILGWTRLLVESFADTATLRRGLATIQRNALLQIKLIEDILDSTAIVAGTLHVESAPIDLGEVVAAAIESSAPAAAARRILMSFDREEADFRIDGDAGRLAQVVTNLLNNSIKFTPAGGVIIVQLARIGSELQLRVTDTGRGIARELLPRAFESFRQGEGVGSRRSGGLGLGLALVQHIVAAHAGTVNASSSGEGLGSTLFVSLPASVALAPSEAEADARPCSAGARSAAPSLDALTVLIVEDDEDARELFAMVLSSHGAAVQRAASSAEALRCLAESVPNVLVSDIGLPGQDGYELISRIRAGGLSAEELPAIALSAFTTQEDKRRALAAGFQVHVGKPVDPTALVALVAQVASGV
jgi:signal transduction histidine kinase/ActR/RegA family two-component response regulator